MLLQLLGSSLSLSLFLYTFQLHAATALSLDVSPTKGQGIALGPSVIKHWDE